jgi:hypothetical protein
MEQIFLPLHLLSLVYVAWNIFHADHMGFNWISGKAQTLNASEVTKYHKGSWIGLGLMILTGLFLFYPLREFLLTRPQFYVKMAFVITLICNGLVIGKLQHIAIEKPFASLSNSQKLPLFISGVVSTLSWLGAAAAAFFLLP